MRATPSAVPSATSIRAPIAASSWVSVSMLGNTWSVTTTLNSWLTVTRLARPVPSATGDDREQEVRLPAGTVPEGLRAGGEVRRAVHRVVVQERAAPGHLVFERAQPGRAGTADLVVAAPDGQRHLVAGRDDHAGGPDLHIGLVNLARGERLDLIVAVVGPVRCAQLWVELAVRQAEPALRDRGARVDGAREGDLPAARAQQPQHAEQVGVGGGGGDEQAGRHRAGDLRLPLGRGRGERDPIPVRAVGQALLAGARDRAEF